MRDATRLARAGAQLGGLRRGGGRARECMGPGFGARCSVPGGPRCCRPLMPAVLSSPPRLAGGDPRFAAASTPGCGASRRSERCRRHAERALLPRVPAAEQSKRGRQRTTGGPPGAERRRLMLGWIERRVGGPNPASGTSAGPTARRAPAPVPAGPPGPAPVPAVPAPTAPARPAPAARHGRARRLPLGRGRARRLPLGRGRARRPPLGTGAPGAHRQRRVTFAGPQLPSTSTARTRTATFAARLRTGRTIPAVGVCSVAVFHGPLLTEYWTR